MNERDQGLQMSGKMGYSGRVMDNQPEKIIGPNSKDINNKSTPPKLYGRFTKLVVGVGTFLGLATSGQAVIAKGQETGVPITPKPVEVVPGNGVPSQENYMSALKEKIVDPQKGTLLGRRLNHVNDRAQGVDPVKDEVGGGIKTPVSGEVQKDINIEIAGVTPMPISVAELAAFNLSPNKIPTTGITINVKSPVAANKIDAALKAGSQSPFAQKFDTYTGFYNSDSFKANAELTVDVFPDKKGGDVATVGIVTIPDLKDQDGNLIPKGTYFTDPTADSQNDISVSPAAPGHSIQPVPVDTVIPLLEKVKAAATKQGQTFTYKFNGQKGDVVLVDIYEDQSGVVNLGGVGVKTADGTGAQTESFTNEIGGAPGINVPTPSKTMDVVFTDGKVGVSTDSLVGVDLSKVSVKIDVGKLPVSAKDYIKDIQNAGSINIQIMKYDSAALSKFNAKVQTPNGDLFYYISLDKDSMFFRYMPDSRLSQHIENINIEMTRDILACAEIKAKSGSINGNTDDKTFRDTTLKTYLTNVVNDSNLNVDRQYPQIMKFYSFSNIEG